MNEADIESFWQTHPCGDSHSGGVEKYSHNYWDFFIEYDRFRYTTEGHILKRLDAIDFDGRTTLELGLGQGADSEQLVKRGAVWSGLDLTEESIKRVRTRFALKGLPFVEIKQGSVLHLPFETDAFDIVFSHGVLHHVPEIHRAQNEIRRVLKPTGELIVMLYAKWSLNYIVSICGLRRLSLAAMYSIGYEGSGILSQHVPHAKEIGLLNYLKMKNFVHKNTDGPQNPYSKVYTLNTVQKDFPDFQITKSYKNFMHAPPLKVNWLPADPLLGWHLWVHMRPA